MNQRIDGNIINSKNHTRRPCQAGYCENAQKGGMRGGALNNPHWQPVKTRWVATQVTTHAAMLGLQRPYGFRAQVTSMFRNRQALSQRGHTEDQTQTCRPPETRTNASCPRGFPHPESLSRECSAANS